MSAVTTTSVTSLAIAFEAWTVALIAALAWIGRIRLPASQAWRLPALPLGWTLWAFLLTAAGVLESATRPPGIVILVVPILLTCLVTFGTGSLGRGMAANIPLWWLVALQSFRLGVEAVLQGLSQAGWIPHAMTLAGGNVEFIYAATALLVAWLVRRGTLTAWFVQVWNVLGVLSLLNVVVRAVGSAPGPAHFLATEVPNVATSRFPFALIPAVMVPLAIALHLVIARAASARKAAAVLQASAA